MYIVNWRNYWRKHFWIEKKLVSYPFVIGTVLVVIVW